MSLRKQYRHSKRKYISVYSNSSAWVNNVRDKTFYFDISSLTGALNFILDNCYFVLGTHLFRQIIGVPIGVAPGPYIANLVLFYYENQCIRTEFFQEFIYLTNLTGF